MCNISSKSVSVIDDKLTKNIDTDIAQKSGNFLYRSWISKNDNDNTNELNNLFFFLSSRRQQVVQSLQVTIV